MPYVLPLDLQTRTLGAHRNPRIALRGSYHDQRFVLPTNSLGGDYRSQRVVLGGGMVPEIMTRPPFRSTMGGFFDESTAGIPNTYLALGGGLLAFMMLSGRR